MTSSAVCWVPGVYSPRRRGYCKNPTAPDPPPREEARAPGQTRPTAAGGRLVQGSAATPDTRRLGAGHVGNPPARARLADTHPHGWRHVIGASLLPAGVQPLLGLPAAVIVHRVALLGDLLGSGAAEVEGRVITGPPTGALRRMGDAHRAQPITQCTE